MSLEKTLALVGTGLSHRAFERDCREPEVARARLWRREIEPLLRRAPFWQARGLPASLSDCPITDHGTYAAALDRSMRTRVNELNGERVLYWAQSSGTSGPPKYFPLTASFRKQFQRTTGPFLHRLLRRFDGLMKSPALYFAATAPSTSSPAGVPIGFISHFNYITIPRLLQRQYCLPRAVLRDDQTCAHGAPLYALATDLSAMFAVTPLSYGNFLATLAAGWSSYLDVLAGQAPMPVDLPRPSIDRARLAMLRRLDPSTCSLKDLWPGLAFVGTWTSSVCRAQLAQIEPRLGVPAVDAIYSATEGWMNVPFGDGQREGGPLHPGAHIVEFLPEGAIAEPRYLLQPWEVEPGRRYEIFLTTAQGMVRYRLHDVVLVSEMFHRSPVISFQYKSDRALSLGLATVSEAELVSASLAARLKLEPHWRFGPNPGGNGVSLFVTDDIALAPETIRAVDAELRRMNSLYAAETESHTIAPLGVEHIPAGSPLWKRAASHAQSKPQYLVQARPAAA